MRHVVLTAMCSRYPEAKPPGTELWGVNRTYTVEPRLDRVYYFDPETLFLPDFVSELAKLGTPVYTRKPIPALPRSVAFPVQEVTRFFGLTYSTCTVAWMLQHAIWEHCTGKRIDKLTLNGMYHPRDSLEYLYCLPCVNFWVGVAMGHGMKVDLYGFNALCKPLPWEAPDYGYRRNVNAELCIKTLSAAYKACYEYPRQFLTAEGEMAAEQDHEALVQTKARLEAMLGQVNQALEGQRP